MPLVFTSRRSWLILLGCSALLCGCGSAPEGPKFVPVKGIVIYQGKPLESGQISFIPDRANGTTGPMASGRINEQGEFQLRTHQPNDGAIVGSHKVVVSCYKSSALTPSDPQPVNDVSLIPLKYADENTTSLTAEVTTDPKQNFYTFELE